jgi:hypothetical protein
MVRLTVKEAAEYLRCSASLLHHLRSKGGGPPYSKRSGKVLYDIVDLEAHRRRRRTPDEPFGCR